MKFTQISSILVIAGPRSRTQHSFEHFLHLLQFKLPGPITQLLVQARKLILSVRVYLIIIYKNKQILEISSSMIDFMNS